MIRKITLSLLIIGIMCASTASAHSDDVMLAGETEIEAELTATGETQITEAAVEETVETDISSTSESETRPTAAAEPEETVVNAVENKAEDTVEYEAEPVKRSLPGFSELPVTLYINGLEYADSGYLIGDVTYVSVREFCTAIDAGASVIWDNYTQTVFVTSGAYNISLKLSDPYLTVNGRYIYISEKAIISSGTVYVPVRALAKALGADVMWDISSGAVNIVPGAAPLESGTEYYDKESLYWLSRIISAEARGEPLEGQIAVGNVVMNRVAYKDYPNSVYGVVFDRVGGVQFTPVATKSIYNEPTLSSIIAAKLVLDGANTAGNSLFFMNASTATSKWIKNTRTFISSIGNHDFYA